MTSKTVKQVFQSPTVTSAFTWGSAWLWTTHGIASALSTTFPFRHWLAQYRSHLALREPPTRRGSPWLLWPKIPPPPTHTPRCKLPQLGFNMQTRALTLSHAPRCSIKKQLLTRLEIPLVYTSDLDNLATAGIVKTALRGFHELHWKLFMELLRKKRHGADDGWMNVLINEHMDEFMQLCGWTFGWMCSWWLHSPIVVLTLFIHLSCQKNWKRSLYETSSFLKNKFPFVTISFFILFF